MITKRCFICGARENTEHHCTNPDCPRYVASADTATTSTVTVTNTGNTKVNR